MMKKLVKITFPGWHSQYVTAEAELEHNLCGFVLAYFKEGRSRSEWGGIQKINVHAKTRQMTNLSVKTK